MSSLTLPNKLLVLMFLPTFPWSSLICQNKVHLFHRNLHDKLDGGPSPALTFSRRPSPYTIQ